MPPPRDTVGSIEVRRVAIVANPRAGARAAESKPDELRAAFSERSVAVDYVDVSDVRAVEALAAMAGGGGPDVVVAAGGDGTINTVANALAGSTLPIGIIPLGTFNYVARRYGIADDLGAAVDTVVSGRTIPVSVGEVAGRVFLNNCSFGLYTSIIQARERHKGVFGRNRIVAAASAIVTMVRFHRRPLVRIDHHNGHVIMRASMVFIGANPLQLDEIDPDIASQVERGALVIVIIRAIDAKRLLKFAWKALAGAVVEAPEIDTFVVESATVTLKARSIPVVIDGESLTLPVPLEVRIRPDAVHLRVPAEVAVASTATAE